MPDKRWIQKVKLKKGSLKSWIRRNYGNSGFTERGTIRTDLLKHLAKSPDTSRIIKQKVNFALRMRGE